MTSSLAQTEGGAKNRLSPFLVRLGFWFIDLKNYAKIAAKAPRTSRGAKKSDVK
jgi:hypothetical protein